MIFELDNIFQKKFTNAAQQFLIVYVNRILHFFLFFFNSIYFALLLVIFFHAILLFN